MVVRERLASDGSGRLRRGVVFALVAAASCGDGHARPRYLDQGRPTPRIRFVPPPRRLIAGCRATARIVGYAVPCPTLVAPDTIANPPPLGCALQTIGPGRGPWRGWVVGSSSPFHETEHLVLTASPRPLDNEAKVVNGPGWYRGRGFARFAR